MKKHLQLLFIFSLLTLVWMTSAVLADVTVVGPSNPGAYSACSEKTSGSSCVTRQQGIADQMRQQAQSLAAAPSAAINRPDVLVGGVLYKPVTAVEVESKPSNDTYAQSAKPVVPTSGERAAIRKISPKTKPKETAVAKSDSRMSVCPHWGPAAKSGKGSKARGAGSSSVCYADEALTQKIEPKKLATKSVCNLEMTTCAEVGASDEASLANIKSLDDLENSENLYVLTNCKSGRCETMTAVGTHDTLRSVDARAAAEDIFGDASACSAPYACRVSFEDGKPVDVTRYKIGADQQLPSRDVDSPAFVDQYAVAETADGGYSREIIQQKIDGKLAVNMRYSDDLLTEGVSNVPSKAFALLKTFPDSMPDGKALMIDLESGNAYVAKKELGLTRSDDNSIVQLAGNKSMLLQIEGMSFPLAKPQTQYVVGTNLYGDGGMMSDVSVFFNPTSGDRHFLEPVHGKENTFEIKLSPKESYVVEPGRVITMKDANLLWTDKSESPDWRLVESVTPTDSKFATAVNVYRNGKAVPIVMTTPNGSYLATSESLKNIASGSSEMRYNRIDITDKGYVPTTSDSVTVNGKKFSAGTMATYACSASGSCSTIQGIVSPAELKASGATAPAFTGKDAKKFGDAAQYVVKDRTVVAVIDKNGKYIPIEKQPSKKNSNTVAYKFGKEVKQPTVSGGLLAIFAPANTPASNTTAIVQPKSNKTKNNKQTASITPSSFLGKLKNPTGKK